MSLWNRINPFKQKNKNREETITEETNTNQQNNYEKEIEELKKQYNNLKNENNQLKKENTKILNSIDERIENKLKEKESEKQHAKKRIKTTPKKQQVHDVDLSGIYNPLPEKYHNFNLINLNKTGFAWVSKSKSDNTYLYNRQKDGVQNAFRANSIEKLYLKVTSHNQPWGIVDYEKASNIISIPKEIITKNHIKKENENKDVIFNEYWQKIILKQYRRPFQYLHLKDDVLYNKSVVAYLQINQIKYLSDNLDKFEKENYTIKRIFNELQTEKEYNSATFAQWMYNICKGKLNMYLTENTPVVKSLSKEEYLYKLFKKSYCKKLKETDYTLQISHNEEVFKAKGRKLNIPKKTVNYLVDNFDKYRTDDYSFNNIYNEIKNDILKLNPDFIMKRDGIKLKILLYNIFTGYFTEIKLNENPKKDSSNYQDIGISKDYLDDNHVFSTDGKILFIDDEDTGLTLANCNNLIDTYINADNKQTCLHNLIRLNEEINLRFICLIFKMYSENMFMNLIKQDKPRVVKINNPQKRRENNLY